MKLNNFIITAFLLFFVLSSSIYANPPMYTVDYKLLIGLHPKMASYDLVLERHLRPGIDFSDMNRVNEINMKIASNSIVANRKIEGLQREIDRFALEKSKIQNKMTGAMLEFNEEIGKFPGDSSRKHQARKVSTIDRDIEIAQAKIDLIWDEVMSPLYLSKTQSRKIVASTLSEIDLLLEQFSSQLGGAVIIDSDFSSVQLNPQKLTAAPSVGADPLSIRLYQSLLHSQLIGDVPEPYKKDPELRKYASRMRKDIEEGFDKNISMQISKQPLFGKILGLHGRLFLAGNKNMDITRQVLGKIFTKHAVRSDIAARILAQIK